MMRDHGDNDCGSRYENVLSTNRERIILGFSTRSFLAPLLYELKLSGVKRGRAASRYTFRQYEFFPPPR